MIANSFSKANHQDVLETNEKLITRANQIATEHKTTTLQYDGLVNPKYYINSEIGGSKYKTDTDGTHTFSIISNGQEDRGGVSSINQDGTVA